MYLTDLQISLKWNPIQNGRVTTQRIIAYRKPCSDLLVYHPKLEKCGNLQNHNLWTSQTLKSNCWTHISGRYPFAHNNYWHMSKHRNLKSEDGLPDDVCRKLEETRMNPMLFLLRPDQYLHLLCTHQSTYIRLNSYTISLNFTYFKSYNMNSSV